MLLRIKEIRRGRRFKSSHKLSIPGGGFDDTVARTLSMDSICQVLEPKPTAIEFINETPGTRLLSAVLLVGFEIGVNTCAVLVEVKRVGAAGL